MLIVLLGHRAAGKTTLGRALAERLEVPFWDSDQELAQHYGVEGVKNLALELGRERFRNAETEWLTQFLSRQPRRHQDKGILALGAGILENPRAREILTGSHSIALWCSPGVLAARLQHKGDTVWDQQTAQTELSLQTQLEQREGWLRETAKHHMPLSGEQERDLNRLESVISSIWHNVFKERGDGFECIR